MPGAKGAGGHQGRVGTGKVGDRVAESRLDDYREGADDGLPFSQTPPILHSHGQRLLAFTPRKLPLWR
jgi:hypothetical protein